MRNERKYIRKVHGKDKWLELSVGLEFKIASIF